ncbi:MAG: zinc ribbon domain-containing protein [Gammaproteobacteria bacterium]|jgi:putative FmdB family regulatory protein|nr:zinc ribbon domain-containing protein [Gammaproteobacteria bacterium]MBT4462756.1 zinc ribbon domain-containing protein [Gammaproteobacteria bacterium]MBT4654368.1 zinc ribbon domain-containing protein [Gammaproteobacteria bacterium]MBT5117312.1 zinc ribbon domain-containing protein [Gammaproteobacteria bacterium]MBT5761883.1 zinc ribbon domain-containing protein [Gammaproteobacteria bacterium]
MPIYEYKCAECGSIFEHFQKMTDKDIDICQTCNKGGVKKIISSSGFRLKGSGWYETDFKGKKIKEEKSAPKANSIDKP